MALLAVHRHDDAAMAEVIEGVEIGFGQKEDGSAFSAIAAIGAAPFGVLVVKERYGAIAALPASDFYYATID